MGISIGGIVGAGKEFLTGANTWPTPQVTTKPPGPVQPKKFVAPDVSADGQVVVHHEHLTTAADVLRAHLPELQSAVTQIQQYYGSFDCLNGWPQGEQMCQNLMSALDSFIQVGQQTHDAHADTSSKLKATARTYQDAETDSTQAATSVSSSGGGSSNWSGGR